MAADLDAVLAELRALRESHDHLARRLVPAADRDELRDLLPLVEALMGSQTWTLAALYAASALAPGAGDLQRRLEGWATEAGGLRELGHVLLRGRGTVHRGLRLVYVGGDRDGALYMLVRVSDRAEPAPVLARGTAGNDD